MYHMSGKLSDPKSRRLLRRQKKSCAALPQKSIKKVGLSKKDVKNFKLTLERSRKKRSGQKDSSSSSNDVTASSSITRGGQNESTMSPDWTKKCRRLQFVMGEQNRSCYVTGKRGQNNFAA